jgi:hypothetical protein
MNNGKTIRDAMRQMKKPVGKTNPYKNDVLYTNLGQWKYPGQITRIPSGDITMQGVPYPVYGEDDLGYGQMMYPGMDYTFPGQYVTEIPMAQDGRNINSLEADLITKVLMNRNRDKDFIQRAYALGQNPGMFTLPDPDQFGFRMSHKMGWGEDETGQAYMFPTVMNPRNESIKVPNQYADYISSIGYKKEAGIPYEAYGGDPSLPNITGHYPFGGQNTKTHTHMQDGGWLDQYQTGGVKPKTKTIVHTDKALFDKAYKAEMDSLYLYKHPKPIQSPTSYDYGKTNPLINAQGMRSRGIDPVSWSRQGDEFFANWKKPVIHNIYQPPVEPLQDTVKPVVAPVNKPVYHPKYNQEIPGIKKSKQNVQVYQYENGGWLDKYKIGGYNYDEGGNNPPISISEKSSEEKKWDVVQKYLEEKRRVEDVRNKAAEIAANKAKSPNKSTRTDLSYIKTGAYYCNTHTGECFQDAGATTPEGKKVPVIPGNIQWDTHLPEYGFEWVDKPEPGDVAREQLYRSSDYQGKSLVPGFYTSHSGIVTQVADPNDPSKIFIGNAPGGSRFAYENQPLSQMLGSYIDDAKMKYQRYVGNLPSMQDQYDKIMNELYNENISSISSTSISDGSKERDIIIPKQPVLKYGGWLDELDEEYRRGGSLYTPPKLKKKSKKYGTSKNIQSSINYLFARNYDLFGPSGKTRYNPNSKYQDGGGYSIVDYLSSKGEDFSKENRKKLAEKYGVKDYDFSNEKNIELLDKLKSAEKQPKVVAKKEKAAPVSYFIKPISKQPVDMPDYSNLSPEAQTLLNKEVKKNPKIAKQLAQNAKDLEIRKTYENLANAQKIIERMERLKGAEEANNLEVFDKNYWTRENLAKATQATADKFRFFPKDPNSFIDEYINPGVIVGHMVTSIGASPLEAKKQNSIMPYFKATAAPVISGAIGMNPFDFVGSGLVKTAGKELLKTGEKALVKQGVKQAEKKLPQAFAESAVVGEAEEAAIKVAKQSNTELNRLTNPKYIEDLRTKGFTKTAAEELQRRDVIKKVAEIHGLDSEALNQYLKNNAKFSPIISNLNTKNKFMKEYNKIINTPELMPTRKAGSFIAKEQAPLKKAAIVEDINKVPKTQQKAAIKEIQSDPLLKEKAGIKGIVEGKLTKKGFENTHMPIATKEQQVLARKNQVMKKLFGEERVNPTKDIADVMQHVDNAPENTIFMGANSLSDSSFPLYTMQAQRAIRQGKVKPLFLGYQEMNPWGHMSQSGINPETIAAKLNETIVGFNKNLTGKAKLPNAYVKNGKVYYPNMALQKGAIEELGIQKLSQKGSYAPNIKKAGSRLSSGILREEKKAVKNKLVPQSKNYKSNTPSLLAVATGSYKVGGQSNGWLDYLD